MAEGGQTAVSSETGMPTAADSRPKKLPDAARRALQEAEARHAAKAGEDQKTAREIGGRKGPEPVRYGDWELNGRAIDF